jgi:hypothetical protein
MLGDPVANRTLIGAKATLLQPDQPVPIARRRDRRPPQRHHECPVVYRMEDLGKASEHQPNSEACKAQAASGYSDLWDRSGRRSGFFDWDRRPAAPLGPVGPVRVRGRHLDPGQRHAGKASCPWPKSIALREVRRADWHDAARHQVDRTVVGIRRTHEADGKVHLGAAQIHHLPRRLQPDIDPRAPGEKRRQMSWQPGFRKGLRHRQGNLPRTAVRAERPFDLGKHGEAPRQPVGRVPHLVKRDEAARATLEERPVQPLLQRPDLRADGGSRDAEFPAAAVTEPSRSTASSARQPFRCEMRMSVSKDFLSPSQGNPPCIFQESQRKSIHDNKFLQRRSQMKAYMIERELPGIGSAGDTDLAAAASTSNKALAQLAPRVQWQHSYVTGDRTYCVYLAENEDAIREHARLSGFPASKITPISGRIDPTTAEHRVPA